MSEKKFKADDEHYVKSLNAQINAYEKSIENYNSCIRRYAKDHAYQEIWPKSIDNCKRIIAVLKKELDAISIQPEPAAPTARWQKCGEDCDCKDECKQLVADTPQIMQELANRDQWQKEAEELSWKEFTMNHLTPKGEKETIIENRGIYVLGFVKARELAHSEHDAHLAQLQGEIDKLANRLKWIKGMTPTDQEKQLQEIQTELRNITQTKTDKG